jgi:hypothetical protein
VAWSVAWSAINDIYLVYSPTAPTVNEMWTARGQSAFQDEMEADGYFKPIRKKK